MEIGIVALFVLIGLGLWLSPFAGWATRLNDVGKWVFIIAFAKWLGF